MTTTRILLALATTAALLATPALASDGTCPITLLGEHGVMQFVGVEGGCWQFQGDSGTNYEPIGGPANLYVHGATGTLSGCIDPGLASTCQVGTIVLVDDFVIDLPTDAWADLGNGLGGAVVPTLTGAGALAGNDPFQLALTGAVPFSTAWLVVGIGTLNAPFKGGVLVPDPNPPGLIVPFATTLAPLVINATWPNGVPSGFSTWFQYWIMDASGPVGFTASNAVSGTTP